MMFRALVLLSLLLAGCASPNPANYPDDPGTALVWPSAPAPERIRFGQLIGKPEDLGIRSSGWRRLMNAVAGVKELGMVRPYAVSVLEQNILVADPGMNAVHWFDRARGKYQNISIVGDESLSSPVGVALGEDRIFIADSSLGKVFILDGKGKPLNSISGLQRPTGLAFDAGTARLYVAETLAHRIVVFDIDGGQLFEFGSRGVKEGEFNYPSHIFLSGGKLLVNDTMNFRIQRFDAEGRFLSMFGSHGDGSGDFSQEKGVAADSHGHIYVAGATIDRVQVFSPEGVFLLAFGSKGNGPGEFIMPAGITIVDDQIYVTDSLNSRVQVFRYVGGE